MSGNLFDDLLGDDDLEIELEADTQAKVDKAFDDMPALNERAMLSVLKRKDTRMTRAYDEDTQEELRAAAGDASLTANKRLFRDDTSPVRQLKRLSDQLYRFHLSHTLESGTTGERVLDLIPKSGEHVIVEFSSEIRSRISDVTHKLEHEVIPRWDELVQNDIAYRSEVAKADPNPVTRQKKLDRIHAGEYPTAEDMRRQFTIEWDLKPLADDSAIARLAGGPADLLDKARADVSKIISDVQNAARADMAGRMLAPINKAIAKLKVSIDEKGSVFRDSLINNLTEELDNITDLCIINDPETHAALAEAQAVLKQQMPSHEAIRTSQDARDKAVNKLDDLAKKFSGLL